MPCIQLKILGANEMGANESIFFIDRKQSNVILNGINAFK